MNMPKHFWPSPILQAGVCLHGKPALSLRDLKANYYPYWENTNALIDSAYKVGKAHILFETGVVEGVEDGSTFWSDVSLNEHFVNNEWLVFYTDPKARQGFDYLAKCRLVSLYVGSINQLTTERTETKQVEDGYDEKLDSAGHVITHAVNTKRKPRPSRPIIPAATLRARQFWSYTTSIRGN